MADANKDPQDRRVLTEDEARAALVPVTEGALQWYWAEAEKWERYGWKLQLLVLILSALVTIFAAAPAIDDIFDKGVKWLVVALSASATFVSALLSKAGVDITAQLRETGRVELVAIEQKAILQFKTKPVTEAERATELARIVDLVREIELKYGINPLAAVGGTSRGKFPRPSAKKQP